jgi:predicted AlkP superfamily phosphohydrolase/phosphomutase
VWAAAATGIYPSKNGVRSAASYFAPGDDRPVDLLPDHCFSHALVHLGIIRDQPNSSTAWRARPLWAILGDYGITTGIVRWPLTYPAEPTQGFLVTDRFHQLVGSMFELDGRAVYPMELEPLVRDAFNDAESAAPDPFAPGVAPAEAAAVRRDRSYSDALASLEAQRPVRFAAIRYQALDTIGHGYLRYVQPGSFATVTEEERQKYGTVLDRAYAALDAEVGRATDRLAPGDLLLVVSGFGMQPVDPLKHLLARLTRQPDLSGTHDRAPDGFLFAYGAAVEPGRRQRGSIVDVTPTVLYYLGVPIGRDMDGYARTDLFAKAFTAERPITFIPSHGR